MSDYSATIQRICEHAAVLRIHSGCDAVVGDPYLWACTVERYGESAILHGTTELPTGGRQEAMAALAEVYAVVRWQRYRTGKPYWVCFPLDRYRRKDRPMMTTCTFAYPAATDFSEAAANVIARLRGDTSIDNACFAHCAWVCTGFALSKVAPDCPLLGRSNASGVGAASDSEMANQLEAAVKSIQGPGAKAIDWAAVLSVVVMILKAWLA